MSKGRRSVSGCCQTLGTARALAKAGRSRNHRAGTLRGSGPLIRRRNDASTDRGEAASSSGGARSYAQGGGGACQRISLDPDPSGVRRATSLYADRDEDRQGIRRAPRGVGGGGVASRTTPTVAPISRFPGATLCANFALPAFCELRLNGVLRSSHIRRSPKSINSNACNYLIIPDDIGSPSGIPGLSGWG